MSQPTDNLHTPHVFTVFRTTDSSVTLKFEISDSAGKRVVDQTNPGITLMKATARRLQAEDDENPMQEEPGSLSNEDEDEDQLELEGEDEAEDDENPMQEEPGSLSNESGSIERRLSGRRRSYSSYSRSRSSSYSYSRSRSSYSSYSSSRSRSSYSSYSYSRSRSTPTSDVRRRAPTYPRRRGFSTSSSSRRRYTGYDNHHYSNPYSPYAGRYGYTSPAYASSMYGGRPPMMSSYGYYGHNAYSGSLGTGTKIALAAGGGLLAGYLGGQLVNSLWSGYTREQILNSPCSYGSWNGICSTCASQYGANNCNLEFSPKIDATRDDLMSTGFIPADYTWPLHVKITGISGVDFTSAICPPNTAAKLLFLTTTAVEQLSSEQVDASGARQSESSAWWEYVVSIAGGLCCCGCACAVLYSCLGGSKQKRRWQDSSSSSDSDYDYEMRPMHPPPPGPYAPTYPQIGFHPPPPGGPNPYWQAGGSIRSHGSSSMGSGRSARGEDGGFMSTASPNGMSWMDYCRTAQVQIGNLGYGPVPQGAWGECVAWAVIFELRNPESMDDSRFGAGPVANVIQAMVDISDRDSREVTEAAERLEDACKRAAASGQPLPIIGQFA